jgi:hypothetical protein
MNPGGEPVRISAGITTILADVSPEFLQFLQANIDWYLKLGHDRFRPNSFPFITHWSS